MDIEATLIGKLKLATLVLGGLTVALAGPSLCTNAKVITGGYWYELNCPGDSREQYFLAISCIALIISFVIVVGTLFNVTQRFKKWFLIDLSCHLLMAILLIIGWVVFCMSVNEVYNDKDYTSHDIVKKTAAYREFMARRCFALIFQFLNFIVYLVISFLIFRRN